MVLDRRHDDDGGRSLTQIRLVEDKDGTVARWIFDYVKSIAIRYDLSLGVIDSQGTLKGGIMFSGYNGSDVEVHFFGPGTLKRHVLVMIFKIALLHFKANRMTVRTRKPSMARGVQKLGAVYEGKHLRTYGPTDGDEHAAHQFVFFRERMAEIAGVAL
jgi:hypothetical protein